MADLKSPAPNPAAPRQPHYPRLLKLALFACAAVILITLLAALLLPKGQVLTASSDLLQLALVVTAAVLCFQNFLHSQSRVRAFWLLNAAAAAFWTASSALWAWHEVWQGRRVRARKKRRSGSIIRPILDTFLSRSFMARLIRLAVEFTLGFVGLPALLYYGILPNFPIPYLLVLAIAAYVLLRSDPGFDSTRLTKWGTIRPRLLPLLLRDAVLLAALGLCVRIIAPHLLFSLVKRAPVLWAIIMLLYPLLSVYPQELLYRAFFFHRYRPLFGTGWTMLLVSAAAFGFAHIIFGNWLAVGLSAIGGLLFALSYQQSGSLLFTCLDHVLFGNFIFTIGLGRYFYHGARV